MKAMRRLLDIMRQLRDPKSGCPWDLAQTPATIVPHTLEEAYEVAEAVETGDVAALRDELGDLLFQVVFYSRLAEEAGEFDFAAVADGIATKLVRRHPHVFGGESVTSVAEQSQAWERHKAAERAERANRHGTGTDVVVSVLDGISHTLPATSRAQKLQRRAAQVGFDWPSPAGVIAKIGEELDELQTSLSHDDPVERVQEELGDLLFSCVNLARHLELDAETALRHANRKFETRFRDMEARLVSAGGIANVDPQAMDQAWEAVKRAERST